MQISTKNGIVQGRKDVNVNGIPYWSYQGIPYAAPPIGKMRFKVSKIKLLDYSGYAWHYKNNYSS